MRIAAEQIPLGGITRVTLLGEQAASKTAAWGSNPHARADCRRGSIEKGVRLVSGIMLVQFQSSALFVLNDNMPCGCGGRMTAFEVKDYRHQPSPGLFGQRLQLMVRFLGEGASEAAEQKRG